MSSLGSESGLVLAAFDFDDLITIAILLLYVLPNIISAVRKRLAPETEARAPHEEAPEEQADPLEALRRRIEELTRGLEARQAPPVEAVEAVQAVQAPRPPQGEPMREQTPPPPVVGPRSRPGFGGALTAADVQAAVITRTALLPPPSVRAAPWRRHI